MEHIIEKKMAMTRTCVVGRSQPRFMNIGSNIEL